MTILWWICIVVSGLVGTAVVAVVVVELLWEHSVRTGKSIGGDISPATEPFALALMLIPPSLVLWAIYGILRWFGFS